MPNNPSIERIIKATEGLAALSEVMEGSSKPVFVITDEQLGDRRVLQQGDALPATARRVSDCATLIPEAFHGIGITGEQLRQQEELVRVDGTIIGQANDTAEELNAKHKNNVEQLARGVTLFVDAIRNHKANPCTPPDLRKKIELHGQPVLDLVDQRNQQVQSTKAHNKALRNSSAGDLSQAHAAADAASLTAKVLRGHDVQPEQVTSGFKRRINR